MAEAAAILAVGLVSLVLAVTVVLVFSDATGEDNE